MAERQGPGTVRYDIGALEQRVYNVEKGLSGIAEQIGELGRKIESRSAINWTSIGVMFSAIVVLAGIVYLPIDQAQRRMREDLLVLNVLTVPRDELKVRDSHVDSELDSIDRRLNDTVPRGEISEHLRAIEFQISDLRTRMSEIETAFGSSYTLADAVKRLQERLDRLVFDSLTEARPGRP